MMKIFKANVHLDGHYTIEDPQCPSYWKGSGCYDIDVPASADLEVEVWAETEVQARKYALEYEYNDTSSSVELDAVRVESVNFVEDLLDRDQEEAGVIEPVNFYWDENYDEGPDPDYYYETRREYERQ